MVMSYFRRAYSSFAAHVFDIPPRLMAFLFFLILLLVPLTGLGGYLSILIVANITAIFAMSWDLLVGRTGQISLGHAIFFGLGGYTTALLFSNFGLPIYVTIPAAMLVGVGASLLIGLLTLRVKGPYLALVTMAFPLIIVRIISWSPLIPIFKGELGIRNLPAFFPFLEQAQQKIAEYYLILLIFFVSAVVIYKIAKSKTGLVFVSILDDEVASKACGINVTKQKLVALMISGLFASLAGTLYAHYWNFVNPPMFSLTQSFAVVIVTFLGGLGTIYGPIVGAYIFLILDKLVLQIILPNILEYFGMTKPVWLDDAKFMLFALIVIILVIKWPRGLARFTTDKLEDFEEARDLDERGPRIWKTYKKKKDQSQ